MSVETTDPAADFASLMNKAAESAAPQAEEAPYGYTTDPDGTRRPKKTPGRPRKSPTVEELRAQKEAAAETAEPAGDRPPDSRRRLRARRDGSGEPKKPEPVVQFREGVIAKGINRTYRKAGKLIKVADADVGQALIDITRKDDDDDVTVGEAWEEIARTNPRIRKFLMRMISGGAWGQLFMCHSPVLMAILMKDAIRKRVPFMKLLDAFLTPDEEGQAPADGTVAEGLTSADMGQMMAMAQAMAQQVMERAAPGSAPRAPTMEAPGPPVPVA